MPFQATPVVLSNEQRAELEEIAGSQSLPAGFVRRAKMILLLAEGFSYGAIVDKLDASTSNIGKWKRRFLASGVDGLETERPGQQPPKLTPKLRARILDATRRKPRDGSTHWSTRKLAKQLSVSKSMVHRVWQEAGLKPHRLERYMASNDLTCPRSIRQRELEDLGWQTRQASGSAERYADADDCTECARRRRPVARGAGCESSWH